MGIRASIASRSLSLNLKIVIKCTHSKAIDSRNDWFPTVGNIFPLLEEATFLIDAISVVLHLFDVSTSSKRLFVAWNKIVLSLIQYIVGSYDERVSASGTFHISISFSQVHKDKHYYTNASL